MSNKDIKYYCENKPTSFQDELQFLSWFDPAKSVESSISSGFTDFMYKIMTNDSCKILGDPSEAVCCEIGFGGGRLLLPASFIFKKVYGIDIHKEFERVEKRLNSFNRSNVFLLNQNEANRAINDESIDFFYSFITFQHFNSWSTVLEYFDLIKSKLKKGGYATIFFGENTYTNEDVRYVIPQTFEDFPMTLYVKKDYVLNELSKFGFEIIDSGNTVKKPWLTNLSRQFYVRFSKK